MIEHLSDVEIRALRIALNQLPSLSSWDEMVLKTEIKFLSSMSLELPTFTGFSSAELDILSATPLEEPDELAACEDIRLALDVVSRPGDIWTFRGGHRLGCLNALEEASFFSLMGDHQAGKFRTTLTTS